MQTEILQDSILFERRGALGLITLNRPKALNAIDLPMVQKLRAQLLRWIDDADIKTVVIQGAGGRAFCAGGDMRSLYNLRGSAQLRDYARIFFAEEYKLNLLIHRYPKPYVALIDGIVMGGGAGLSIHGAYRVATERTLFAMPETAIGFFPDVGGLHFLQRCPGHVGKYLALSGVQIDVDRVLGYGLANFQIGSDQIPVLIDSLSSGISPETCLAPVQPEQFLSSLKGELQAIDRHFVGDNLPEILARMEKAHDEWAKNAHELLMKRSPLAMAITWRYLQMARGLSLPEILRYDFRLALFFIQQSDFFEGIRAVVVDKDRRAQWRHENIHDVPEDLQTAGFAPPTDGDLELESIFTKL